MIIYDESLTQELYDIGFILGERYGDKYIFIRSKKKCAISVWEILEIENLLGTEFVQAQGRLTLWRIGKSS